MDKDRLMELIERKFYGKVDYAMEFMESLEKEHKWLHEKIESLLIDYFVSEMAEDDDCGK